MQNYEKQCIDIICTEAYNSIRYKTNWIAGKLAFQRASNEPKEKIVKASTATFYQFEQ